MNFTVKHQAGQYHVVDSCLIALYSFDNEQEAEQEAKRLNEEYERVLSFL